MKAIAEMSLVPIGTADVSICKEVARVTGAIKNNEKLQNVEVHAMGTIFEGEVEDVLEAAGTSIQEMLGDEVQRVMATIHIDARSDKGQTIRSSEQHVESEMSKHEA